MFISFVNGMSFFLCNYSFILNFMDPFLDGCSNIRCPIGSSCANVPGGSVTCRCNKPGYEVQNGKCVKKDGAIVKITGLKFDQKYKDEYRDKNSVAFKSKAAEIENVLKTVVCEKIIGCIGIRVIRINKGSIVVDYSVIVSKNYKNVTGNTVLDVTKKAMSHDLMTGLRVIQSSSLSAQSKSDCFFTFPSSEPKAFSIQCHFHKKE